MGFWSRLPGRRNDGKNKVLMIMKTCGMRYDFLETGVIGTLILAGDEDGLRRIDFEAGRHRLPVPEDWKKDAAFFREVKKQLAAYFAGELQAFDLPLAPEGTPFQLAVWESLRTIPYGALVSYRDVAAAVGKPKAARPVGGAVGRNPLAIVIPCHRVVGSNGSLTGFGGGLSIKQRLIDLERAIFLSKRT